MERTNIRSGFAGVDRTDNPDYYVGYLDAATSLDFMQRFKRQSYEAMGARPGMRLLDVGCGTGDDVRAMVAIVGPDGSVVGVDNSKKMVGEARKRAEGLDLPVKFQVGNAAHLDFEDNSFDACRAERILIHVDDPRAVLAEMVRVTKPGGYIVTSDADWDMVILDAPNQELTRKVLDLVSDGTRNNWIARQVPGIMKQMGLQEVSTVAGNLFMHELALFNSLVHLLETIQQAVEGGLLDAGQIGAWLAALEERDRAGLFFGAMTGFISRGRKAE
jgi:ubiquinone/menaquinone biosynthesis C-methylase UbiE